LETCLFIAALTGQVNAGPENVEIAGIFIAARWLIPAAANGRRFGVLPRRGIGPIWTMGSTRRLAMPAIASTARLSRPLLLLALIGGLVMAATLALWAYYGTAVFFEMVRTGWVACF
jgi:hypothetical protein